MQDFQQCRVLEQCDALVQEQRKNKELLALLKEALQGCNQTAYRDWAVRAEAAIKEIKGETKQCNE